MLRIVVEAAQLERIGLEVEELPLFGPGVIARARLPEASA